MSENYSIILSHCARHTFGDRRRRVPTQHELDVRTADKTEKTDKKSSTLRI